jgi:hypothetical protein
MASEATGIRIVSDEFGDWDPDDSFDHEPPAPEQVAYRLHHIREEIEELIGRPLPTWDELDADQQAVGLALGESITNYINANEPDVPEPLAHALHDFRQAINPALPDWDDLSDDDHAIGTAIMDIILKWLRMEGAIA